MALLIINKLHTLRFNNCFLGNQQLGIFYFVKIIWGKSYMKNDSKFIFKLSLYIDSVNPRWHGFWNRCINHSCCVWLWPPWAESPTNEFHHFLGHLVTLKVPVNLPCYDVMWFRIPKKVHKYIHIQWMHQPGLQPIDGDDWYWQHGLC